MAVYAKKVNGKQRSLMKKFEALCGLEFMGQDDLDAGTISFGEAWDWNLRHLGNIYAEVQNLNTHGAERV